MIWIVPLLAILVGLGLAFQAIRDRGPEVSLQFALIVLNSPTSQDFSPCSTVKAKQCSVLLNHLKTQGSISTIEGREKHGISHVAGRMHDLRNQGFLIETRRVLESDSAGRFHTIALYSLKGVPA